MLPRYILNKIDPDIINSLSIKANDYRRVILSAKDFEKCRMILKDENVRVVREFPLINAYSVDIPQDRLAALAASNVIRYISSDVEAHTQMDIAAKVIGASRLHRKGITGKGITIAVIDTGISPHRDFTKPRYRIKAFKDFVEERNVPYDDNGHGTFVAGVAAGNGYSSNGKYRGVAPDAQLVIIKAMDKNGSGDTTRILDAMQWINDNRERLGIKVVSMSIGAMPTTATVDALASGADALWEKGLFVVAAAGNSGPNPRTITTPGVSHKVVTVGASDDKRTLTMKDDTIADFSSRGPANRGIKPDIVAPGVDIVSTKAFDDKKGSFYTKMSGTSVATPMVAGAAAFLYQSYPGLTPHDIKQYFMMNAYDLHKSKNAQGKGSMHIQNV